MSLPVSYTHLDVYKRQDLDSALEVHANNFKTLRVLKENLYLTNICCSPDYNNKEHMYRIFKSFILFTKKNETMYYGCYIKCYGCYAIGKTLGFLEYFINNKAVSYTHLDVYKRQI